MERIELRLEEKKKKRLEGEMRYCVKTFKKFLRNGIHAHMKLNL